MYDTIVKLGNSKIQHGTENDRIYLMHLATEDMPEILTELDVMACTYGYTKIFAKAPKTFSKDFLENGYVAEATVLGFYKNIEDCIFMSKFLDDKRSVQVDSVQNKKVLDVASSKNPNSSSELQLEDCTLSNGFTFRKAQPSDANKMAEVYSLVFDSYPFPVFNPEYIKETMNDNVVYFGIWNGDQLIALSSCEMCLEDKNVEMTDFAILPEYRGYKFSHFLLEQMEKEMKKNEINTAYTIARSNSFGMNSTFAKCGYRYGGILVKNTQIGGKIEDMNIWFKSI
ncbi:MAG: putative beta-lysine N-acetyltransferase [Anaerotignaceae bacterium]